MNWRTIFKLQTQRSGSFQLICLQFRHQTTSQESVEQYWIVELKANEKTDPEYTVRELFCMIGFQGNKESCYLISIRRS
jgi:hypothetical protein